MASRISTGYEVPRTKVFEKSLSTKTLAEQNSRSQVEYALVCKGIVKTIEDCNIKIEDFTRFLFKNYPKETAKFRKGFYNPRAPRTQEKGDSCSDSRIEQAPKNSDVPSHGNTSPTVRAKGHSRAANNAPTNQKLEDKKSTVPKEDGNKSPITSIRIMYAAVAKGKDNGQQDSGNRMPKENQESGDSNSSSESTDSTKKRQRGCRGRGGKRRQETKQIDDERKFVSKSDFEELKTTFKQKLSDLNLWRSRQDSSQFLKRDEAEDMIKSMVDRKQVQKKYQMHSDEGYFFRKESTHSSSDHDEREHFPRRDTHQVDHRRAQRSSNSRYEEDRAERERPWGYY